MKRLLDAWSRGSPRQRHFITNIVAGIAIAFVLSFVESNVAVAKLRDALLTAQVAQFGSTGVASDVLWLDVDESTYLRWRAPPVTPRDRLCRLIDFALSGNARVVVVDIDLTRPSSPGVFPSMQACSPDAPRPPPQATSPDGELSEYLHEHARICRARLGSAHCAPIVLTRELRTSFASVYADGATARVPRATFIETSPFDWGDAVVWSSPNFDYDSDSMIRRWRLWEPVCDPPTVVPSSELLAAAIFAGHTAHEVQAALSGLKPRCVRISTSVRDASSAPRQEADVEIGYALHLTTDAPERRFFYRTAWDAATNRPSMAAFVPAQLITEVDSGHRFDPAIAANRVVVIGGSYGDNPDFHRTPVGTMPGTLVLINAIQALITDDHVRELPIWLRFLVEGVLIGFVSALFLYLRPWRAMLASSVVVIALTLSVGYYFLNRGYWIDPVLPLVGIQVHELIALAVHRLKPKRTS